MDAPTRNGIACTRVVSNNHLNRGERFWLTVPSIPGALPEALRCVSLAWTHHPASPRLVSQANHLALAWSSQAKNALRDESAGSLLDFL